MTKIKKLCFSIMLATLIFFTAVLVSGCYIIKSGKMKDVVGTYELIHYSGKEDRIERDNITLYVVIKSDGTGYYAYSDFDTPLYYSELKCRYIQSTEKSGYYDYVELEFNATNTWEKLGINMNSKTLNSREAKYKGNLFEGTLAIDYYIDVDFKKVSSKTDMSYIEEKLGADAPFILYGAKLVNGTYSYSYALLDDGWILSEYENPFVYFYLSLDIYEKTGEAWYMRKADEQAKHETFHFTISGSAGEYTLTIGSTDVIVNSGTYVRCVKIPQILTIGETTHENAYWEYGYRGDNSTYNVEEAIERDYQAYLDSKTVTE